MDWNGLLYSFVGLFVAMDIIGIVPIYLGMSSGLEARARQRIVDGSILVACSLALVFVYLGEFAFKLLGITLYDFKVGGGIVLMVMSILELVRDKKHAAEPGNSGIVPLGVPLITGPALVTIVMLQVGLYGSLIVSISLISNFAFAWFALTKSSVITRVVGVEGTIIMSKVMALFTTAIAFSMIRAGIFDAIAANTGAAVGAP